MRKSEQVKFRKQFTNPKTNKLESVYFGDMAPSDAIRAKEYIERLIRCLKFGTMPDETVIAWLDGLNDSRHEKLAQVGLVSSRSRTTLARFLESCLEKLEVAENTRDNYLSSRDTLLAFFGADCKPETLTKRDAEAYRDYLKTSGRIDGKGGYGKNSVWKKLQHAGVFFRSMQEESLIRSNPFEKVKEAPENTTERKSYVSDEYIR